MSTAFDNVIVGKLKLKGKALDVRSDGVSKKKKTKIKKTKHDSVFQHSSPSSTTDGNNSLMMNNGVDAIETKAKGDNGNSYYDDRLTPAERRYLQQREKLEQERLAKMASKSHRDRVQEFNQYLANLSEHYDIPKVGPG